MGNQAACCAQKDSELDKKATTGTEELNRAEAVPALDEPIAASPTPKPAADERAPSKEAGAKKEGDGTKKGGEGTYTVTLDKASGGKLGLDVDYMAERKVLPVMNITGGLAEQWNQNNPEAKLQMGDSVLEVNGVRGNVAVMIEKCKNEKVLSLLLVRNLTYDALIADLERLVTTGGKGPLLICLSFNDAGVFSEGKGGCPNAVMRFTDAGESKFKGNKGLTPHAMPLLKPISDKYCPHLISNADLWALAANVAIRLMGGPTIPTRFGRVDATSSSESVPGQEGRFPEGDKGADHLRAIFHAKGFDDKAIVALSGAHTVGRCHPDRSGFDGAWTEQCLKFDNAYFKDLVEKSYAAETTSKGCPQHKHAGSGTIMLPSDLALMQDSSFEPHVRRYAQDQSLWFNDFATAWTKLQESGCEGFRDVL